MTITAEQAIEKITAERTTFLGVNVRKISQTIDIRNELQRMAENNEISPAEYKRALDITMESMSPGEKRAEYEKLNKD